MLKKYFKKKPISFICIIGLIFCANCAFSQYSEILNSPSGLVKVAFFLSDGRAYYSFLYKNDTIVRPSSLGFVLIDNDSLISFQLINTSVISHNETWLPVWGQFSSIKNDYNELRVELKDSKKNRLVNVLFRAYDDGVAFRYIIPEQSDVVNILITSEESRIELAGNYECWWSWADYNTLEKLYFHTPLDSTSHVAAPFTLKKSTGTYICILEAAIDNYSTMTLKRDSQNTQIFKVNLVPWADGTLVKSAAPLKTPWRVFVVSDRLGGLIESNLVLNLNDSCVITDVSWIAPMTYIGIWWEMHLGVSKWVPGTNHGATTENAKKYIDFASAHKIKGVLIEGWNTGWENWGQKDAFDFVTPYPDFNLREVVEYAHSRGVEIIGHHETGGDTEAYEKNIEQAFALYQKLGIHSVKTGYAGPVVPIGENHHGQCMVQHYNKVMRLAAKYQLMLDVHEPVILSGLSRTYPNLMTAEGVRGMEWNAWSNGNPPSHTCTLPFTRGIAGPMDYTPGIFDIDLSNYAEKRIKWNWLDNGNTAVHSTIANQLALMVVLFSPLQMAADLPQNYEGNKAFSFIENLPTCWDETKVLDAAIGEYVVIARRKGNTWFLGAITDSIAREINLPLNFLKMNKKYTATIYADGQEADFEKNPEAIIISERKVVFSDSVLLNLARGGGAALRIEEIK